jgi:hypothetical protein
VNVRGIAEVISKSSRWIQTFIHEIPGKVAESDTMPKAKSQITAKFLGAPNEPFKQVVKDIL